MKNLHLIATVLTGKGLNDGFIGDEWYNHRLGIFKKYTVESLANQTESFFHWIMFRKEEENKKETQDLFDYLNNKKGYHYIPTFEGFCFLDDKAREKNKTLKKRLMFSLTDIERVVPPSDWVYLTCIDSDEMVHKNTLSWLSKQKPKKRKAFIHKKGYIYNLVEDKIADWYIPSAWSTMTIVFPSEVFFNAEKNLEYQEKWDTHEKTPELFDAEEFPENMFMTTTHGKNRSTTWSHPYKGKEYKNKKILKNFK